MAINNSGLYVFFKLTLRILSRKFEGLILKYYIKEKADAKLEKK